MSASIFTYPARTLFIITALLCWGIPGRLNGQVQRTLTVGSLPYSGVGVTVSPTDLNGDTGAFTGFARRYANGTVVTLTAPTTLGANSFVKWKRDGADFTTSKTASVTVNADYTMTAVYFANNQLLTNGSFESGFTEWTVTGNAFLGSVAPYTGTDGVALVSFNGNATSDVPPTGVLSQTFATTPGTTYTLAFDMGAIGSGTGQQRLQVTATGTGNLLTQTATKSSNGTNTAQWSAFSYTFVANSTTTTVTFSDTTSAATGADALLDNVRVTIGSPSAGQALTNGSFESDFTGWTKSGNAFIGSTAPYTGTDGVKLVSFNGNATSDSQPNAVLSQSFATTAGTTYTLAFDMGVIGSGTAQQRLQVTVDGTSNLLTQTATKTSDGTSTAQWSAVSYTFVANSPTTTLTFRDNSAGTTGVDALLDNVRVTSGTAATAPVAVNDSGTINAGQKVRLAVLANDSGIFDPGTLAIVSPPTTGMATVVFPGEILYAHAGTNLTPVSFTYRVAGDGGQSQPATVNITISSALRIPNNTLNVPATPPPTEVQVVPTFPGVTFTYPLCFVSPPGDTKRLFVCERDGKLKVIPDVTVSNPTSAVVLDLAQVISSPARNPKETLPPPSEPEAGFLGMAFHPNYATNGYFYVSYMVKKASEPTAIWFQRLSRFTVPAAQIGQPAPVATPSSELILIEQRDRGEGHNGNDIHFGADGCLYWSIGDEADPDDTNNNAQRIDMNFFSAILRIDVDKKPGNLEPNAHPNPAAASLGYSSTNSIPRDLVSRSYKARYSIPIDNPFVSTSQGGTWNGVFNGSAITAANLPYVRSEFWAVGLRNPWRFFIDAPTGEVWSGDVGQDAYEEVDLITRGGNYGWSFREGLHAGPKTPPGGFTPADPIYEYPHSPPPGGDSSFSGSSIIGGVVYRGTRLPSLTGAYIFGDNISGHIWALTRPGGVTTVKRIAGQSGLVTFGSDPSNGDVLISDYLGGRIMRLVAAPTGTDFPGTLSATRLFADLTDLSPSPGVLPYTPNLTFWSDYAVKRRWFIIPDATSEMTWSRDGLWTFPSGQIWVKHFDLETERGNPLSPKKRIETRVLVKNDNGAYGVSYRWNEAGTEATLVADGGDNFPVHITVGGSPYTQQWSIPSRSQCITCHSPQAGHALSFNTRQINLDNTINGFTGNQLDLLRSQGYFSNTPESSKVLPRHLRPDETAYPLEARVRSYLAVNCAYCHSGVSGTAPTAWDGRHHLPLDQTGLINGNTGVAGGAFKLIVPGDTTHSVVLQRMGATGGFTRMPPLGSNEVDPVNIALVTNWINQSLPNRVTYDQWRLATFGSPNSAEGDPAADPDGDGVSNWDEFLAGTLAWSGSSFLSPGVSRSGPDVLLNFSIPENRSVQVESSDNLTDWSLWDIPGNDGVSLPGGGIIFSGPATGSKQFFRLRIWER